jgi:hypothetical protein
LSLAVIVAAQAALPLVIVMTGAELLISEKDIKAINAKKKSRYLYEELIFIILRSLLF